ncbi:oxidoreductase [Guyanagaster necrorhizus]|uniref:3-dehydrosphinganine reductase n=1 Tax=Guyanagaster necrorhizus TaxID=856835 RepID=A0A9P8AQ73_9AGAR|nr:oxidoreductase [Guyanagaster necrorhizus MCA 3950]KAG7443794.1 oxidoreductase [Guyanagaster necrorhizus MCA 3950]
MIPLLSALLATWFGKLSGRTRWDPLGKHCYITGGSSGLGLALAIRLVKLGAHVSIVARNEKRLQEALEKMENVRQSPDQILAAYSFSVTASQSTADALDAASAPHGGRCPDALFLCAGGPSPKLFLEHDETSMKKGMDDAYWVQALSALEGTKRMVNEKIQGKIIFISSFLAFMSIVGHSSYASGKFALRGLAETLRSEFLLYGITVHIFFPGNMLTPGLEAENKTKPKITLKLEETDTGQTAEHTADGLLQGVFRGDFHITNDLLGNIFRSSTRGATPRNSIVLDEIYSFFGWVGLPVWRRITDSTVRDHREEHRTYLMETGFLVTSNG